VSSGNSELSVQVIFEEASRRLASRAPGFRVRQATINDIDAVIDINLNELPEHYPRGFFEELLEKYNKAFYVAENPGGCVVGYVMTRIEIKPGFFKHFLVRSGHVVSIAVKRDYRRLGLGYALMAYAMRSMYEDYKCSETYLEVRVSNKPAISLYEKLGYKIVKIEKQYYLDGEDAYVMARKLP